MMGAKRNRGTADSPGCCVACPWLLINPRAPSEWNELKPQFRQIIAAIGMLVPGNFTCPDVSYTGTLMGTSCTTH
jgi:hypothetical protein